VSLVFCVDFGWLWVCWYFGDFVVGLFEFVGFSCLWFVLFRDFRVVCVGVAFCGFAYECLGFWWFGVFGVIVVCVFMGLFVVAWFLRFCL